MLHWLQLIAFVAIVSLPAVLTCNWNVGAYKLHNGQGEMNYMDNEKDALYSEQGVWVSWKVPVARHWDPRTGRIFKQNPGKSVNENWYHWNTLTDDNPPTGSYYSDNLVQTERFEAPDPYREYLREYPTKKIYSRDDEDLYFLSAGSSREKGTSVEMGVIKAPRMPNSYKEAMKKPSFTGRNIGPRHRRPTTPPIEGSGAADLFGIQRGKVITFD